MFIILEGSAVSGKSTDVGVRRPKIYFQSVYNLLCDLEQSADLLLSQLLSLG